MIPRHSPKLLFPILTALLAGCTVGPDYVRPPMPTPAAFKELKGWKQAQPKDHLIPDKWWEIFKDPQLNALEEQVAISNQSIAQAVAQYHQAQALVQSARAAYFPTATATSSINRFRAASGTNVAVPGVRYLFSENFSTTWQPDLWGAVRRQVESNIGSAQASAATLQALRLSTRATLAQDYFQMRALDAQKKLLDETVESFRKSLELTQNRYAVGVAARTDVVQAEAQLESARAQAIDVGVLRAQMEHAVAVLTGKAPSELSLAAAPLTAVPPPIPAGIPSQLLERRPDIASAERQIAAANALIGVAKAAYFPTVTLSANNGFQTNTLTSLFSMASRYWALGPSAAVLTLFDGGARHAQMQQAIAAFDAAAANYRQTVLTGFQQVEDNLAALRILEEEAQVQDRAVQAFRESLAMTTNQYKAGTVSYLNVMVSQTAALSSENASVQLHGKRLSAAVLLVTALGGGWDASALPEAGEAGGEVKWTDFLPFPVE
jgi:NodT family efflux transporter outer membrane factor (OMF) lipoprotein